MNLRQIEFALALAEEGHFTRAAQRCHVVQSALSHQIARLEDELGTALFERLPRNVRLTAAGEAFLPHARAILASMGGIRRDVGALTQELRGHLTLGCISALGRIDLIEQLAHFHHRHPGVDIRLRTDHSDNLLRDLIAGVLDIAYVGLWHGETLSGVESRLLLEEPLLAIVPPGHPLSGRSKLRLAELAELPLVDYPEGSAARRQTDEAFASAGLAHRVQFEINHPTLLARFVSKGLAVGLMPRSLALDLPDVVQIPVADAPVRRVYVAWRRPGSLQVEAWLEGLE